MGNTALMSAIGCTNTKLYCTTEFADLLYTGGANVNHRNRQGQTTLGLASASSCTFGECEKRSVAVKWLLEHGANPDIPDNSGFTPRMNGQYSKVITKLYRDEDKRRESLPTHCRFCIYIPPENFEPGFEKVAEKPWLVKEKEPPRTMMMCAQCHKVAYCSKECQRNDWKHHRRSCKPTAAKR